MAQHYAAKYLNAIDERFVLDSRIGDIINNGDIRLDYSGVNSVTIYNVDVVAENDYIRSGYNRYGDMIELGNGIETFTLTQDKAFTFSVDKGNVEDSMHVTDVNKAVRRQVREVSVVNTDKYVLAAACLYARTAGQGLTNASLTKSTIWEAILVQQAALIEASVPEEGLYLFLTPTMANNLRLDPQFKLACDFGYKDNKEGTIGKAGGMVVRTVPSTYLYANTNFLIIHKDVLIVPKKFNSVKIHDDVVGIDGSVAEGRRYYDCFIPTYKGVAMRISASS